MKKERSMLAQVGLQFGMVFFGVAVVVQQSLLSMPRIVMQQNQVLNQPVVALLFACAAIIAFLLARRTPIGQLWNIFFGVLSCTGLFAAFFYSLPQTLPVVFLYGASVVLAGVVIVLRVQNTSILVHNAVLAWACIGIARIVGAQFSPLGCILVATVVAAYAIFSTTSAARVLPAAQLIFAQQQQFAFIVTPYLRGWVTETADSPRCARIVSAVDATLMGAIAASFLIRGYTQFFVVTILAVGAAVVIARSLQYRSVQIFLLPVLVGCCIAAVYGYAFVIS